MSKKSPTEAKTDAVQLEDLDGAALRPARTNLLLSATIETNGVAGPVRIRNLSDRGALLEGAALPPAGSTLVLRRLHLEMSGTVVWVDRSRCGVQFAGTISVAAWRAGNWIAPIGASDQARLADSARNGQGASVQDAPQGAGTPSARDALEKQLAQEMLALQKQLADISALLAAAPESSDKQLEAQAQCDLVGQTLGHLAQVLDADDRDSAIEAITMEQLRWRLQAMSPEDQSAQEPEPRIPSQ